MVLRTKPGRFPIVNVNISMTALKYAFWDLGPTWFPPGVGCLGYNHRRQKGWLRFMHHLDTIVGIHGDISAWSSRKYDLLTTKTCLWAGVLTRYQSR